MSVLELIKDLVTPGEDADFSPHSPAVSPSKNLENKGALAPLAREVGGKPKIEVIPWLSPCPLCGGRDFIERKAGGFFCPECTPVPAEEIKRKVRAPGEIVRGLGYGCGRCGNRTYRQVAGGWMCEGCGIEYDLISGSRGPVLVH